MSEHHNRNSAKHEYEIQQPNLRMVFVGNVEKTAIANAVEYLAERPGANPIRLYHSYPSPGPLRRYVGVIDHDGTLHRPA